MVDRDAVLEDATAAFFDAVFKHLPPATTGDIEPLASQAFTAAARAVIEQIERNVPEQAYYVLYRVEWKPEGTHPDETPPMDRDHSLRWEDDRITGYGLQGIGSAEDVLVDLRRAMAEGL